MTNKRLSDKFTWQEGDVTIKTIQCVKCQHKTNDVFSCTQYTTGKPMMVLRVESLCPKYIKA